MKLSTTPGSRYQHNSRNICLLRLQSFIIVVVVVAIVVLINNTIKTIQTVCIIYTNYILFFSIMFS